MSPRARRSAQVFEFSFASNTSTIINFLIFVALVVTLGATTIGHAQSLREFSPRVLVRDFEPRQPLPGHINVSATLPIAMVGQSYNAVVSVSGGKAPYRFSVTIGSLPTGLVLNPTTGSITGTPVATGTSRFAIFVFDGQGDHGDKRFVLPVGQSKNARISISPSTATLNSAAQKQFTALVRGTAQTAVTWSASQGNISRGGMFTAPSVQTTTTVTVTASSTSAGKASASVTVMASQAPPPPPPPPPSNSLTVVTTTIPGASLASSYAAVVSASGGTLPYNWTISSGSLPSGIQLSSSGALSGMTTQLGQFSFTVQVTDAAANTASQSLMLSVTSQPAPSGNFDGPAELPRVHMLSTMADTPAPGNNIAVSAGGNLQNALNAANCGDTITLQAGATFTGAFTLPAKACDDQHWIIIRTSAPDSALPPEGTRLTPCFGGVASLPGRPALNCSSTQPVLAKLVFPQPNGSGPVILAGGANHYRLLGLEITRAVGTGFIGPLISGHGTSADHIVIDRSWVHGTAQDESVAGISLTAMSNFAVIDSYINDFHCTSIAGSCTDAHAVSGGLGSLPSGTFQIVDNFLEASGENILFGGGPASTTPADIEIRRNHFFKPMQWMPGSANFVGGAGGHAFVVKNHLELKNAQRVLVEGNIMENSWGGFSQVGFSILLTPKNQAQGTGNVCPICQVTDVTIRFNTISHVGSGISLADALSDNGGAALAGERYSIHDVTLDDISASKYTGGGGLFQIFNQWHTNVLNSISINHVTGFPDPSKHIISLGNLVSNPPMWGLSFTNSIVLTPQFPVWSTGGTTNCAAPNTPLLSLTACFTKQLFTSNALVAPPSSASAPNWPSGNFFPASFASVQFVNFNGGNGGDYHLLPSSPYKNAATDGQDLGADIDAIQAAIAGVY